MFENEDHQLQLWTMMQTSLNPAGSLPDPVHSNSSEKI